MDYPIVPGLVGGYRLAIAQGTRTLSRILRHFQGVENMRLIAAIACVAGVVLASARSEAAIINGSFETPLVPVGGFTNFGAGSTAITGWTVVGVDTAIVSGSFQQSGVTFNAQHGAQWADLAGITSNSQSSGVSQNVATIIGATYSLSFWVGSTKDLVNGFFFPSTIDVSIDGGARQSYFNPATPSTSLVWQQFTHTFVAANASTNIRLLNGGASNNFNSAVDNVSLVEVPVNEVPEPASLALFGAGALGLLGVRRRRQCA